MIDTIFTRAAVAELLADLARPIRPIVEADRRRHTAPAYTCVRTHTHTHAHTHADPLGPPEAHRCSLRDGLLSRACAATTPAQQTVRDTLAERVESLPRGSGEAKREAGRPAFGVLTVGDCAGGRMRR